jgi:hypothetical protein
MQRGPKLEFGFSITEYYGRSGAGRPISENSVCSIQILMSFDVCAAARRGRTDIDYYSTCRVVKVLARLILVARQDKQPTKEYKAV